MKVCITGAAGAVAQNFIPLLCNGSILPKINLSLSLLDIPQEPQISILNGLKMELEDCNFSNLLSVSTHTNSDEAFIDCDLIIFIGGFPRKQGMERKDLLKINSKIFKGQALSLKKAKKTVKMLVVANPCNTNAKILADVILKEKIEVDVKNISSLSRLDQNRAEGIYKSIFNKEANIFAWGNHSNKLFIDSLDKEVKSNLKEEFIKRIQDRGAEIIKVKGSSSTFSAAAAIRDHLRDWFLGSDKIVSMGVYSEGEYDTTKGLIYTFPIKCKGNWSYEIIKNIEINEEEKKVINACNEELNEEASEIEI